MKRFLIECSTNWCGEEAIFSAYAEQASDLDPIAAECAYDNFNDYPQTGHEGVLEDLFPGVEEYTDEMHDEASEQEGNYYFYTISEWDETRDEKEWEWYDLIYDARESEFSSN